MGERIDDLRDFDPEIFVDALLGNDPAKAGELKEKAQKMMKVGAGNGASSTSMGGAGTSDTSSRLRSSFEANASGAEAGGEGAGAVVGAVAGKAKRKPRPKPTPPRKK